MPPPDGIQAKLRRTDRHLKAFSRSLAAYQRNTYALAHDTYPHLSEPSRQKLVVSVVRLRHLPLARWSIWLDEIAYHLRSALDAAVYDLSINAQRPDPTGTAFPIGKPSDTKFDSQPVRYLSREQQAFIEALQPYQAGNDDLLFLLHEVNRRNKHRNFQFSDEVFSLHDQHDHTVELQDMEMLQIELHEAKLASDLRKKAPLVTFHYRITGPKPDMKVNAGVASKVVLWGRQITTHSPTEPGVFRRVQGRVMGIIAELYRLPRAP